MGWALQGPNPYGGEIFCTCSNWPSSPQSLQYSEYRVAPEVKWLGHGVDHPPSSSAKVNERVELYRYSHFGPSWPLLGANFTFYLYLYVMLIASAISDVMCSVKL